MAEEKNLKQMAFEVGKGRVTSDRVNRTANTLSRAASGLAGYAYNAAVTADNIMTAFADKQTEEEKNSQNKKFDPEQNAANSIIESRGAEYVEDNFKTWSESTYDDGKIKQWSDDWIADMSDAETLASKTGVTVEQAQNWLNDKGDAWLKNYNVDLANLLNKVKTASGMANIEATQNNIMGQPGNINDNLANYQKRYNEGGFGAIDIGGKYDPSTPQGRMNAGLAYVNSNITADADYAIKTGVTRNEFVESYLSSADSFMDGYIPEDDETSKNLYSNIRSQIEEEAGKAYDSAGTQEILNSTSKNSVFQQLLYEFMENNGFESPNLNEIYEMINQSGLDFSNLYDREYIQNILKGAGYTEEVILNDKVRNAISSITDSDFLLPENKGLGVYDSSYGITLTASGYTFTSSEKKTDSYYAMAEAFASGRGIATNHQAMIDNLAKEYGIETGSEDYKLLASSIIAKEVKLGITPLDFNTQLINNLFYSDASDDEVRSFVASMASYGSISYEDAIYWYDEIKNRQTVYTPFIASAKNIADEYIKGLDLSAEEKAKITNLYKNSPDADKNWENLIYSKSGSPFDMGQIRGLTIEEVEQYIDGLIDVYCSEKLAETQGAFEEELVRSLNGDSTLATPAISDNESFIETYIKSLNDEYEQFINNEAIVNARIELKDNETTASRVFDTVSRSIYGKPYDELEDSEKNIVYINANYALASDAQVKDLYKTLYGSRSVNSEYAYRSDTSNPQILNNVIGKNIPTITELRNSTLPDFENLYPTEDELDSFKLGAKTKEIFIEGLGYGLMDSDGYVYAIMPTGYQSGNLQVIGFYYPKNSSEYKSVWSSSDDGITINVEGRSFFLHNADILQTSAPVEPGGNAITRSSNTIGSGLAVDSVFISKKKSLRIRGV